MLIYAVIQWFLFILTGKYSLPSLFEVTIWIMWSWYFGFAMYPLANCWRLWANTNGAMITFPRASRQRWPGCLDPLPSCWCGCHWANLYQGKVRGQQWSHYIGDTVRGHSMANDQTLDAPSPGLCPSRHHEVGCFSDSFPPSALLTTISFVW